MRKASWAIALLVLVSTFHLAITILPENVRGATLYVGGTGPGNFTSIQAAIDAAFPGDTVFVFNGTYVENIMINKTLTLRGEDSNSTLIDGNKTGDVVVLDADWVNITGFRIIDSGSSSGNAGISLVYANNCSIRYNTISNSQVAIDLSYSNWNIIMNNTVSNIDSIAIALSVSENNTIAENTVLSSSLYYGLVLVWSDNNTIVSNIISVKYASIVLSGSKRAVVTANNLTDIGIYVGGDLEHVNTHNIDISNQVNGKPVHYWKNTIGGTIPLGAGQIILANCSDVVVEKQNLSGSGSILLILHSLNVTVVNNTVLSGGMTDIHVYYSDTLTIANNDLHLNQGSIYVEDTNNMTVSDNELHSSVDSYFFRVSNISIIRNNISNGTGLHLQTRYGNTTVIGNTASNTISGTAFYVTGHSNKTIADNVLSNCRNGFLLAGGRMEVRNNTIVGCENGIFTGGYFHATISGNTVHSNTGHGIILSTSVSTSVNNSVYGNNVTDNGGYGLFIAGTDDNVVFNNTIISNKGAGIHINDSFGNFIHSNIVSQNSDGVYLYNSRSNRIANNTISLNTDRGFFLLSSGKNMIDRNEVSKNGLYGIHAIDSFQNDINNNTFSENEIGIYFKDSSYKNAIVNNTISSNNYIGVFFWSWGFGIDNIYHNSLIDNAWQSSEWGQANEWDNGYPSGGNFWSDYTGIDEKNGPNQDVLGSDNIGDTPYGLWSRGDQYPLMYPYGMKLPKPPTTLEANLNGGNSEDVTVSWLPSLDESGLTGSIVGYEVRRNTSFDRNGLGYQPIASLPNGSFEFVDTLTGEGDPNDYFYTICSIDTSNRSNCAARQAAKYTRPLNVGPNLLSTPLIQSNNSLEAVLQTVKWDNAWSYHSTKHEWEWLMKDKPYPGDTLIFGLNSGMWINVTRASNFTLAGLVPHLTSIDLYRGWNLVGFPSFNSSYTVGNLTAQTGATRVEGFDGSDPPYFLRELTNVETMLPGYGYWVWVDTPAPWIIDGS